MNKNLFLLLLTIICACISINVRAEDYSSAADNSAKNELRQKSWVKDLYVSPGYMNIGVIKNEKDWSAPMIGKWACAVLAKHGSKLNWVRFVDIEAVVYKGKSPRDAEITKVTCHS